MKKPLLLIQGIIVTMLVLWFTSSYLTAATSNDTARKKTFILAKVGDNPKKVYPRLKPLADYLASHLKDLGIEQGEVVIAPDNKTMVAWLRQGKVDLVTETPFSAMYIHQKTQAMPIARGWRKGVPGYHTIIFVHKESTIQSLDDLQGHLIAFEDKGSTSAYFLPAADLLTQGYSLAYLNSVRDTVPATAIGYLFSGEEINSTTWVHKKLVSAAALSNLDWNSEDDVPRAMRDDLRIIYKTPDVPRSVILASPSLSDSYVRRLSEELFNAHRDPQGEVAMKAYKKTTRFDPISPEVQESLNATKKMLSAVKEQLE